jgi:putative restriction endonuclease
VVQFLSSRGRLEEVNFWQPGGHTIFMALQPGELFLFKLHSPRNFIVGGGVFAHSDILPDLSGMGCVRNEERGGHPH